jgi:hypothetical protein
MTPSIVRLETASLDDILARLEGRVFHVTRLKNWPRIQEDGRILPSPGERAEITFGRASNGFFRKRECVSLFDYRTEPTDKVREFRARCYPFRPAMPPSEGIAILIIKQEAYGQLIPWTSWKDEKAFDHVIVPHAEAGYPGPLPIDLIEKVICLTLTADPMSLAAVVPSNNSVPLAKIDLADFRR